MVNVGVDPYHYFGTPQVEGLNANKPYAIDQHRLAKLRLLDRAEPTTLIIGNSRLDVGLDPSSPHWPEAARPVFNLAIPGQGLERTVQTLDYAMSQHNPATIFWGIDFLDFLVDPNAPDRASNPLVSETPLTETRDLATVAISIEGLVDSVATLAAQGPHDPRGIRPDGFNATESYAKIVRKEGHAALFRQKNLTYIRQLMSDRRALIPTGQTTSRPMRAFADALDELAQRGVGIILITYPYHADLLESFHLSGLWPVLEEWRSWVSKIVSQTRTAHPGADIQLWDFIGYSEITTEPVPAPGDLTTNMSWYWESGHFQREVGDQILSSIFTEKLRAQDNSTAQKAIESMILPSSTFTRQTYHQAQSKDVQRIEDLFEQVAKPN